MDEIYSVPLAELVKEFHLDIAFEATDYASIRLMRMKTANPPLNKERNISYDLSLTRGGRSLRKRFYRS